MDKLITIRTKAYSYVRMSAEWKLKGGGLRRLLKASLDYADRHGLDLVDDVPFADIHVPTSRGLTPDSGTLGQFLEAVRQGRIAQGATLIVEAFERVDRQDPTAALAPFRRIIDAGIRLVTLTPEMVFEKPVNTMQLMFCVMEMGRVYEESSQRSARMAGAWATKRQRSADQKMTRRCPAWLRLREDRSAYDIIPDHAAVVRRIFDDAVAGIGAYSVARRLNREGIRTFTGKTVWQTSTINKIIGNQAVLGHLQLGRTVAGERRLEGDPVRNYFPAIIDQETFDAVQISRRDRRTAPADGRKGSGGRKGATLSNLFSKVARCGYCDQRMMYQNKGRPPKGYSYLVCASELRGPGCKTSRWRYDEFETSFLAFVEKLNLTSLVNARQQTAERSQLEKQLETNKWRTARLKVQRDRTYALLADDALLADYLKEKLISCQLAITEAVQERARLEARIAQIDRSSADDCHSVDEIQRLIQKARAQDGADAYKLRSTISARLQAIVTDLRLFAGDKRFEVRFRDDSALAMIVDPNDPLKFIEKSKHNLEDCVGKAEAKENALNHTRRVDPS
jgi:Recombinase/Recombinase zinc beta ribbon domain